MNYLFLVLFLGMTTFVYADRVCFEKSTGKLIEYQSTDAPLGTLVQNAVNGGYKANGVEEKYITKEEWLQIKEREIDKPARDKIRDKEAERKQKEDKIKQKLGLSDNDFKDLKEVLK